MLNKMEATADQNKAKGKEQICVVCRENASKYKCPKCGDRYCSVQCCKKHKEACAQVDKRNKEPEAPDKVFKQNDDERVDIEMEDTDRVSTEKLHLLSQSTELKELLQNPHLRQMLQSLDKSIDPAVDMESAMQEPIFTEFADVCLKTVEGNKENGIDS